MTDKMNLVTLIRLQEECNELALAITKALRFGGSNFHPETGENNYDAIYRECADVVYSVGNVLDMNDNRFKQLIVNKHDKVDHYKDQEVFNDQV